MILENKFPDFTLPTHNTKRWEIFIVISLYIFLEKASLVYRIAVSISLGTCLNIRGYLIGKIRKEAHNALEGSGYKVVK
jgi:hypothetical protein